MTLDTFLAARLSEDEAETKPQAGWLRDNEKQPGDWARYMFDPVIGPFGGQTPLRNITRGLYVGKVADPDRVLRDITAGNASRCGPVSHSRHLATVYNTHPDYRPQWAP